jgi:asparagine synthase (glutamine-hydrolysing)
MLLDAQALRRGYFNETTVRRLIDEHQSGKRTHSHRPWELLTFEVWHRMFIDAPEVCAPH